MNIVLRDIVIPSFGIPTDVPLIPPATYARRCLHAYAEAGRDWLIVYADREHLANMVFLCGYEPRFEEALLLLGPSGKHVLIVGNEGLGYAPIAGLPGLKVELAQTLSLMGQDRSSRPSLEQALIDAGLTRGATIGLVGWKYLERSEWDDPEPVFFVPHCFVQILARVVGGRDGISDATPVLMHPSRGLRATIDADQIALHEWGAARASAAVWRILTAARAGESELAVASAMGYAGEVLSAHVMFATGDSHAPVIGMRSPTDRRLRRGDGATTAIGYWGGLSSRAGLIAEEDDEFLRLAADYFAGLVSWYEAADIGVTGASIFDAVAATLARGGLYSTLNPGHLTGHDEWVHTPIRPHSSETIASGMPFQVDIIPAPVRAGWALNCEDGVAFADGALRDDLRARHPAVFARIEARRGFMRDILGLPIKDSILPLSTTPMCLPPFWLAPTKLLVRE